jgi:meso-butanediol dehydrogenase / (S,S)-butanediol dehydrogenase / diacetyl reductase
MIQANASAQTCDAFTGQVAFVTGAGSGIGRAIALALAEQGADIGFLTRSRDRAASLKESLVGLGRRAVGVIGDVGKWPSVRDAVAKTTTRLGPPTLVVANAGVELTGTVLDTSPADWDRVIATNLTGVFFTCKAVTPALLDAGGGSIVVIGSDASLIGSRGYAAYNASKHGLVGLSKCMALDFGQRGVRTNIVCPSFIETEMMYRVLEEGSPEYVMQLHRVPLGRFGRVDDVTQVVLHLLSPAASFTNGAVYQLDGGSTATAARDG